MNNEQVSRSSHWLQGRFVLIVFLAFAGLLFFTNQLRFLPLLLLLACPLMHLFMHRGLGTITIDHIIKVRQTVLRTCL